MLQEAATTQELSRNDLISTRWTFGHRNHTVLTDKFRFGESGAIHDYHHDNEARWELKDSVLKIYQRGGQLMWTSDTVFRDEEGRRHITLKTKINPKVEFLLSEYKSPLRAAEFLFPKDLRVTPTKLRKILMIGSCLTTRYHEELSRRYRDVHFDRILFNFGSELPEVPQAPVDDYDLQYVQIPLRSVVSDRIVWAMRFNEPGFADEILKDGFNLIDVMLAGTMRYNTEHGLLSLVSNFFVPQMSVAPSLRTRHRSADLSYIVRRLNEYLAEALDKYSNACLVDVDAIGDSIGKRYVLDDVIYFYSHGATLLQPEIDLVPGSRIEPIPPIAEFYESKEDEFIEAVYEQIVATYRIVGQMDQVKAVVFDLDNTLWRGQIAEHYRPENTSWPPPDGWPIGLWETVHHLRARGILTAVCSKNDRETVEKNWANAVRPEFLSLADFSSVKINWQPKAENILAICEEFNIKPKSVVFVDDNPVERAAVKAALPAIRVIGSNPYFTRRVLLWAPETQVATLTDESIRREGMIRKQMLREETRTTMSREEFLATLGCTLTFSRIADNCHGDFGRALELINKTNQFNTTGKRWSHSEISRFLSEGGTLLAFRVTDKFADYGLVGVLLVSATTIEQFVMSCRVLGMEVEETAVAHVVSLIRLEHNGVVSAPLIETPDNTPCRGVYTKCGFRASDESDKGGVFLLAVDAPVRSPAHAKVKE